MRARQTVRPDPESVLDGWPGWDLGLSSRPRLVTALPGGSANRCYEIEAGDRRLVLRIGAAGAAPYGIDRDAEALALGAASRAGLAPVLHWRDAAADVALFDYVEGARLAAGTLEDETLAELLRALADVHALEAGVPVRHYGAYYLGCLRQAIDAAHLPAATTRRLAAVTEATPTTLVHHDPGPDNVIFTERGAILLDWEYAARGCPTFDYATVVTDWQVSADIVAKETDTSRALLDDACELYVELCDWWARGLESRLPD